jgi:hypothetical protein
VIEVGQPSAEVAKALGLAPRAQKGKRKKGPSCDDCYFRKRMLCALDLDGPCSTFRPDNASGLLPPRQPSLLIREPSTQATAPD